MDFLKSGLKTVLGAPEPGQQPSAAETVERLVDRVNNSTLLEDRRDACRALKAMSRKYRVEVGAQGMDTLKQVERLVDRVNNSTLLEDRRDACRALKAMSRKYRVEVGAQGMDTLKQVPIYQIIIKKISATD
ncbi:general vesicular transport factor p115-like [Amyelois transitella]|uniref:general vesicular transport factor p115-like n=1 Tax=Amyelois transitella TaxID=680683 RepID=UPI00298FA0E7|nr:general vesicular transport factor p115-like [Amyelois transitella]XP_060804878.1 general vesicular transport factor p115-like [Amyelois transitella]